MKVSIITAVKNNAEKLVGTLASVAEQRVDELEHIVIDGASTDNTLEVVERFGTKVSVLISEPDAGVYDAFNKGLRHASGELIGFLNAGDRYIDEWVIHKLVSRVILLGVDAVFADVNIVHPHTCEVVRAYSSRNFSVNRIASGFMPAHPTLFVRRSVFEKFGGFDASYRISGDFEFVARVFGKAGILFDYVPEALVLMEDGGLSNRGWRSKWIITKEMRRACNANDISSSWARLLARLPAKYFGEVLRRRTRRSFRPN